MKQLLFSILAVAGLSLSVTSCWDENLPEAGAARHQVTDLKAVPGDEEALLSWSMPEGWNPTEYIIKYTEGDEITLRTSEKSYTVSGLTNGETYTFDVQAVYGDLISGAVSAVVKPVTSRFAVTDLAAEGSANMVILTWTKPSTSVSSYTLTYSSEKSEAQEVTIEANKETYIVDDLENDVIYTFSLVANYAKGPSEPAVAKAMPALATPYFLDRTTAAVNQPIKFTFNTEGYPSATHAVLSGPAIERLNNSPIKKLILTDSINQPEEKDLSKAEIVSVGPLMGEAIKLIQEHKPVSPLFNTRFQSHN